MPHGIQSGDALADRAVVWTRADRPSRMWVEWSTVASFSNAQRVRGPYLLEDGDYTGRVDLGGQALARLCLAAIAQRPHARQAHAR